MVADATTKAKMVEPADTPLQSQAEQVRQRYAGDADRPLGSYVGTMATYGTVVAALTALVSRRGGFPERIGGRDLALIGVATHKISRLVAKDTVTSPVRAPFTRFQKSSEASEVEEQPRGHGAQHAIGELISCPFCTSQWVATVLCFGLALAPRPTRFAAGLFTTVSISDALQFAFARAQRAA